MYIHNYSDEEVYVKKLEEIIIELEVTYEVKIGQSSIIKDAVKMAYKLGYQDGQEDVIKELIEAEEE